MKVLFVSSGNSHYGIVPFIKSQGESLKKEGIEIDYFTIIGKSKKGYFKNIFLLRDYLKKNRYDIIHAHYGLVGLVCVLTLTKIPIILSIMGSDAYGSFDKKGKRILSSYIIMFLTQIAIIFATQIIVKSKNILAVVPYKKKTHVIPNGVNFELFQPTDKEINKNTVLFLANKSEPNKNFALVMKAMGLIDKLDVELLNPYPILHNEISFYLNRSSVFVLTSYNEGSPNVIKEAMACNIPIVSTNVGDVKEVFGCTEGCYITSFEEEDVADKIKMALDFGKRTNGRISIQHLDERIIAKKIVNLYKKVLLK